MTSMTVNSTTTRRSSFARVPAAFRLQFAVPYSFIWLPIIIFVLAWALTYGVLGLVDSQIPGRIPSEEPINATGERRLPSGTWALWPPILHRTHSRFLWR